MSKRLEIKVGSKYGMWTIIKEEDIRTLPCKQVMRMLLCVCDCGNKKVIQLHNLRSGHTKSCGCLKKQLSVKHGMYGTRQYIVWGNIIQRITNPKSTKHKNYQHLSVCEKWKTFEGFWEDMAEGYQDHLTIDRIDNNKGYYRDNCQWSTHKEQQWNKSNNHNLLYKGEKKCLAEWAEEYSLKYHVLRKRIISGWTIEKALTTPVQ